MNNGKYCVYLLSFRDDSTYVGITQHFQQRIVQHQKNFIDIVKIRVLHVSLSAEQANIWERIEIANYKSYAFQINSKGYNKTLVEVAGWHDKKAIAAKRENKRRIKIAENIVGKRICKFEIIKLLDIALHHSRFPFQFHFQYIIKCIIVIEKK